MINHEQIRKVIVKGLKEYLGCPVVKSNQNAHPPKYPYIQYTVINPKSQNNGTFAEYDNGIAAKPHTQTWSITALSDDDMESVTLADKAHAYLDYVGTTYLNDNDVIIQSVTGITNRDNVITVGYEYKNGFDCFVYCLDEVESLTETGETIDEYAINGEEIT